MAVSSEAQPPDNGGGTRRNICDFAGSLAASIAGAATYALVSVETKGAATAASVPLAMAAGSVTEYGVKSALEDCLLPANQRDVSKADLAWGAVDGLAGIAGGMAEKSASQWYLDRAGRAALGDAISKETATQAGKDLVRDSAATAIKSSIVRGTAGGAAAGLVYELPRSAYANRNLVATDPLKGLTNIALQTTESAAFGGLTGGVLGGATSALRNGRSLIGSAISKINPAKDVTWVDIYSVNDFHSNLDQLPKLKTRVDQLVSESHANGRTALFVVAGDPISGHVNFAFTNDGRVEYQALADIGKNADATVIGLGNHEYDSPGGRFHPERFPDVIRPILENNPNVHLVNTNLDVSAIPGFEPLIEKSITVPIRGADPADIGKLGVTAVTTEEGALAGIRYNDALKSATSRINQMRSQGIRAIQLTTHIGANEDADLAKGLLNNDASVVISNGGHSHTPIPTMRWISSKQSFGDTLKFWQPADYIPNVQAGNSGRWLSVSHIAINPDGTANRYLSTSRLEPLTDVPDDPQMRAQIDHQVEEAATLKNTSYDARVTSNFSLKGTRERETAIGNLLGDSIRTGLQNRPGIDPPQIALVNSGGIRSDIYSGRTINRLDLSNVIMNAGRPEKEVDELTSVQMPGSLIKKALEFGVRENPAPEAPTIGERLNALIGSAPPDKPFDPSGNFLQVSGMKYSYDVSRAPYDRITDMQVLGPNGQYTPLDPNQTYSVVTRYHAIDKWIKAGLIPGSSPNEIFASLQSQPVKVSQVDLLGDFLRGKTLSPQSMIEGRITNTTSSVRDLPLQLDPYLAGIGGAQIAKQVLNSHSASQG